MKGQCSFFYEDVGGISTLLLDTIAVYYLLFDEDINHVYMNKYTNIYTGMWIFNEMYIFRSTYVNEHKTWILKVKSKDLIDTSTPRKLARSHIHIYIHTCIHTYMHTYIHAYIHTYTVHQNHPLQNGNTKSTKKRQSTSDIKL